MAATQTNEQPQVRALVDNWLMEYAAARGWTDFLAKVNPNIGSDYQPSANARMFLEAIQATLAPENIDVPETKEGEDPTGPRVSAENLKEILQGLSDLRQFSDAAQFYDAAHEWKSLVMVRALSDQRVVIRKIRALVDELFPESGPFPAVAAGDNATAYQRKHQEGRNHWNKYLDNLVNADKAARGDLIDKELAANPSLGAIATKLRQWAQQCKNALGATTLEQLAAEHLSGRRPAPSGRVPLAAMQGVYDGKEGTMNAIVQARDPEVVRFVATGAPHAAHKPAAPGKRKLLGSKASSAADAEADGGDASPPPPRHVAVKQAAAATSPARGGKRKQAPSDAEFVDVDSAELAAGEHEVPHFSPKSPKSPKRAKDGATPTQKRHPWTQEETDALLEGVQKFGKGNWSVIKNHFKVQLSRRTVVNLKDKFRTEFGS